MAGRRDEAPMIKASLVLGVFVVLALAPPSAAAEGTGPHDGANVTANTGGLTTSFVQSFDTHEAGTATDGDNSQDETQPAATSEPATDLGLLTSFCAGTNWTATCAPTEVPAAPIVQQPVTQSIVLAALRRIEL